MQCSESIKDIMIENNDISHISDYRKIKWLLNEGLLVIDKIILRLVERNLVYIIAH
jgi:hypothetical protein